MRDHYKNDFRMDRRSQNNQRVPKQPLDMKFISSGYYSDKEKKKFREDLITEAEKLGRTLATLKPELTTSQLRRFFNEVRSLEERTEENFDEQKALVLMLKSKVAYAVGKKTSKTPKEFKDFIDASIDKISDKKDFDGFVKLFESVVGYFYYYKEGGT